MPIFSSNSSWTNQAKSQTSKQPDPVRKGGLFSSRSWTSQVNRNDKRCPPIGDCKVKQTLMASAAEQRLWGVRTPKEVKAAKALAAKISRQQRAGRTPSKWPYAGSYQPLKDEKGKGKNKGKNAKTRARGR